MARAAQPFPRMIHARATVTSDAVRSHYDELDPAYRTIWGEHVHHGLWETGDETDEEATDALVQRIAERLGLSPGQKLCDVGCGYGASARYLADRHGVDVIGLTLSPVQAAHAARVGTARGRVTCRVGDWLANDLPTAHFDHAYAIESSEHMADKDRFFAEAHRVLRPGGRLAVCAWLAGDDVGLVGSRLLLRPICEEGRLPSMGTRAEYDAMAADAGLGLLTFEDLSARVRKTWTICARRVASNLVEDARFRHFALGRQTANRDFLFSLPRLVVALRTGAMRYGLFVWERPRS